MTFYFTSLIISLNTSLNTYWNKQTKKPCCPGLTAEKDFQKWCQLKQHLLSEVKFSFIVY